jgi:Mlc titration factor MtfA (ptsG expression regulator)
LFSWLKTRARQRALASHALPDDEWHAALRELPFLDHYAASALARLRELTTLFLVEKSIVSGATTGNHVLEVTPHMRILIAVQACLLVLGRGASVTDAMADFDGWENVVVYPGDFPRTYDYEDEAGVVHRLDEPIAGESWYGGPVLLSWPAVAAGYDASGMALVIHEFAHKIDMLDGEVDGIPPLAPSAREAFRREVSAAYEDFCQRVDAGEDTAIDPYAAELIDEFFAVSCEVFFAEPELLRSEYPAYFAQLQAYFHIDPITGTLQSAIK